MPDAAAFLVRAGGPAVSGLHNFIALPLQERGRGLGGILLVNFVPPEQLAGCLESAAMLLPPISCAISRLRSTAAGACSARLLEALLENTEHQLVYLDRDFNFLYVNAAYARGCGYSRAELIGGNHFRFFPNAENQQIFEQARDRGESVEFIERPFQYPNQPARGTTYWNWKLFPIKGAGGWVEGLVLSLADVTEQVRRSKRLQQAERDRDREARMLESIVENASSNLAYLDHDLRILRVNSSYCRDAGKSCAELVGQTLVEVFPDDRMSPILELVRDTGRRFESRESPRRIPLAPERGITYWDTIVIPLRDEADRVEGLVISSVEVTEHVKARERMLAAEKERTRLAERVAAEINHRMKNNLAMVVGLLHLQLRESPEQSPGAGLVRGAITRIQTFAAIHEQLYERNAESVDLLDALRRIGQCACEALSRGNIELSTEGERMAYPPKAAISLCVVANEMITNAIKHGASRADGKIRIKTHVAVEQGLLNLSVWNSGNPIASDFDLASAKKMGLRLIHEMAVEQYQGTLLLRPEREGTLARIMVDDGKLRAEG